MHSLQAHSCKLYNDKYIIPSTQLANTEIFTLIPVLIFNLLSRKVLFINRKVNRNYQKVGYFLRNWQISVVNYCKIINSLNAKFSIYSWNTEAIIYQCFFNLHDCTFKLSSSSDNSQFLGHDESISVSQLIKGKPKDLQKLLKHFNGIKTCV